MASKNSRTIKSFEPAPDVLKILEWASSDGGFKLGFVINSGIREWAAKNGYGQKKDARKKELQAAA